MLNELRIIIVSGLSGSGKSVALHALEDLGYYCIDNLPAALLNAAVLEVRKGDSQATQLLAVGVDARNRSQDLAALPRLVADLRALDIRTEVLFLHATDEILLQRYSESRRRHPLSNDGSELLRAIATEREMLNGVQDMADLSVDTSNISVYELAELIRERVDRRHAGALNILIESFGFKHGIPADADFVFDLRCLPNPYWSKSLRALTGLDEGVISFLEESSQVSELFDDIASFFDRWIDEFQTAHRSYLTIALGCTGGQHRSVYMAERLARHLKKKYEQVMTRHNGIDQHRIKAG